MLWSMHIQERKQNYQIWGSLCDGSWKYHYVLTVKVATHVMTLELDRPEDDMFQGAIN